MPKTIHGIHRAKHKEIKQVHAFDVGCVGLGFQCNQWKRTASAEAIKALHNIR